VKMAAGGVTKGQVLLRGCAAFLGVFAGLCAIFALIVTAGIAWQEHIHAEWPEVTARVQRCAVVLYTQKPENYRIDCRLTYQAGANAVAADVYSLTTPAPRRVIGKYPAAQMELMEDWAEQHPEGTPMIVHYDPANPGKAALVTTDMPRGGPQTPNNLKLLGFFAAACALLLAIARVTRLRSDAAIAAANSPTSAPSGMRPPA
jgi:hypothetical protein